MELTKIQEKRLLNVAMALRDGHAAKQKFTMDKWVFGGEEELQENWDDEKQRYVYCNTEENFCGTPACALGHYAARTDLQRILKVSILKGHDGVPYASMDAYGSKPGSDWDDVDVMEHFGIGADEFYELFDCTGCNSARTALQAAKYIEKFVQRKQFPGRDVNKTNDDFYY